MEIAGVITIGISGANLVLLIGLVRRFSRMEYEHEMMWRTFAGEHGLTARSSSK